MLCEVLEVSRSGYYQWLSRLRQPSARAQENGQLTEKIREIHQESRQTYGSPRIHQELTRLGHRHGRNRIARLMRQNGFWGRQKKRYRVRTTDSNHDLPVAPNRLASLESVQRPNQVWVGDITYIHTAEGWAYLAAVMDLYSRRIVGWALGSQVDTNLTLAAWRMALGQRKPSSGLIFHSDRGVQYASQAYRQALKAQRALPSMSRKACCYDNAAMESFWSTLKWELIYRREFATRAQARVEIFSYIEGFYNRHRRHSALNYNSPVDFENRNN